MKTRGKLSRFDDRWTSGKFRELITARRFIIDQFFDARFEYNVSRTRTELLTGHTRFRVFYYLKFGNVFFVPKNAFFYRRKKWSFFYTFSFRFFIIVL